jgi:hypothetical protein
MTSDVTSLRLRLRANGFSPLPLMGKAPAMEKWTEKLHCTDAEIQLWPKLWHFAHNTGVLAKFAPGIDIDLMDEAAAKAVEDLAREFLEELGDVHVRFGQPPRRLIPLRTDEPFTKLSRRFKPRGNDEDPKLEILADGQQYVVHGIHPNTRLPYRWFGGDIETIRRETLPYVRREDMVRFLDAVTRLLTEEFGYELITEDKTNGGDPHEVGPQPQAPAERIAAALAVIPNTMDWAGWNAIAMATWRATGGSAEGFAAFDTWSRKYPKYSAEDTAAKWAALFKSPPTHIGAGTIFYLADQASPGWRARAIEPPVYKSEPSPEETPTAKLRRFTAQHLENVNMSMAPNYLVKGILPRVGLGVIWGPPKCGKSFWTFDLAMHIATGRQYRGHPVRKGTVVYLALEGSFGFARRVEAWRQHHQPPKGTPFYLIDEPINLIADAAALITDLRNQLSTPPAIVVIDTLNRALLGDENKSDDMAKFIRTADTIRTAFNCLVLLIHHCGIAGTRPRGHTSLAGADDVQIIIERDKDGTVIATVEHMKDGPTGAVLASKLEMIDLGVDTDGDPISSCIIAPAEGVAPGVKLTKVQRFALDLLERLIATEGVIPPPDVKPPIDFKVCLADTWRKRFYQEYPADKQDTRKKALLRATLELEADKLIVLWREYVWVRNDRQNAGTF